MACDCVKIRYEINLYRVTFVEVAYPSAPAVTLELLPRGTFNGRTWYKGYTTNRPSGTGDIVPFVIYYDSSNGRYVLKNDVEPTGTGAEWAYFYITALDPIPTSTAPVGPSNPLGSGGWESTLFSQLDTTYIGAQAIGEVDVNKEATTYNGENVYLFNVQYDADVIITNSPLVYTELGQTYALYYNNNAGGQWEIGNEIGGANTPPLGATFLAVKDSLPPCPPEVATPVWIGTDDWAFFSLEPCDPVVYNCLNITYSLIGSLETNSVDVNIYDVIGGVPSYQFTLDEYPNQVFRIVYADYGAPFFAGWYLITLGPQGDVISYLENDGTILEYPFSDLAGSFGWAQNLLFNILATTEAKECPVVPLDCGCGIDLFYTIVDESGTRLLEINLTDATGIYKDRNYYEFSAEFTLGSPIDLVLFWNGWAWDISDSLGGNPLSRLYLNSNCPVGEAVEGEEYNFLGKWETSGGQISLSSKGVSCTTCGIEDRTKRQYEAVILPKDPSDEFRGLKGCCECEQIVLGSSSGNSWENDLTSSWIKVNTGGSATFKLTKNGLVTNYVLDINTLVNDPNTIYTTINWGEVLASDGVGCYELSVSYNIGGILGSYVKGIFKLQPYTIANAKNTARVKAVFNLYHESEGIDFTGSNVISTYRFYGFIGNRQPNTEIDNIIYSNRELKSVIRENLNTYEILTDPLEYCILNPLIDLYLLSENELYISDYNAFNHSYKYQDLPVILEESPEVEYYQYSRLAKLSASVSDKFKNKRTYFK